VHELVAQPQLSDASGGLGPAGEEGLGAGVDAPSAQLDRRDLAAE
jgi:hypothetical protein